MTYVLCRDRRDGVAPSQKFTLANGCRWVDSVGCDVATSYFPSCPFVSLACCRAAIIAKLYDIHSQHHLHDSLNTQRVMPYEEPDPGRSDTESYRRAQKYTGIGLFIFFISLIVLWSFYRCCSICVNRFLESRQAKKTQAEA